MRYYRPVNITDSRLIKNDRGSISGFVVNSHTSGTLKLVDGIYNGVVASQTLTSTGTNPADGDTVTIDAIVYRFKNTLAQAYDVKIGANASASLDNLKAAINNSGLVGTDYFAGTNQHPTVVAGAKTSTTLVVSSYYTGSASNAIVTTETSAQLSWGAGTLAGGTGAAGKVMMNTFSFPSGSSCQMFPEAMGFDTALLAVIGGTADITLLVE